MIKVEFFKSNNQLTGYEVKGHSMYAPHGEDIVCAFVSSACLMAANTLTDVKNIGCDAIADDGFMKVIVNDDLMNAQDILCGLKLHLEELQKDYPNNINVIISEV